MRLSALRGMYNFLSITWKKTGKASTKNKRMKKGGTKQGIGYIYFFFIIYRVDMPR